MAFLDDLSNFGSGLLDSVGEGFDNLVGAATSDNSSVNANTQPQATHQADDNGNKVTPAPQGNDKTLLYIGGGLGALLLIGIVVMAAKK
ncbi:MULTISPECIES: hypothetical protein [Vibrio]|uniref:Uncharacterized protein n=5 Tax=Vibrio TaxID=662 RepID=A0A1R4LU17_VIBR1|nr:MULTISPECIES: hypothetical protein [Vibrio]ASA56409.1 hypothetical protein BSQ33_12370 [Vibrio gazogenes]MDW6092040.1 hypothetical protein [Vibrio rhizosphaerae]WNJ96019.1 hypothetical protein RND59_02570 [Vibrio ruber]SJN60092.1 hypothetical protein VR7878_03996 [Vibrio ruber DSM 16370]